METKKLYRSTTDVMVAGICGGIAEYFGIDSSLIRIGFVILLLNFGSGFLAYLILWFIIPKNGNKKVEVEKVTKEIKDKAKTIVKKVKKEVKSKKA